MKLKYVLTLTMMLIGTALMAQTRQVSGLVKDSTGLTLPGTVVRMYFGTDSTATAADANGKFIFPAVKVNQFSLLFTLIGYQPIKRHFVLSTDGKPAILPTVIMKAEINMLKGVTVVDAIPMKIKEDTVEYNTAAYKVRDGDAIQEAVKKMPGLDVASDGTVTAQGKTVSKVRVNGKDFFGGDVKTAMQNIPADLVSSVKVVDDYGDQAALTGVKTGDPSKVLDFTIKASKNHGYFGQLTTGGGSDALPSHDGAVSNDARYVGQATLFTFDNDRQISVLGNLNNTNTPLFTFGGPGGGRGPGGPPQGSSSGGITTYRSLGVNYRDSWGKKVTVYGNYSFADNGVDITSSTIQQNLSPSNASVNNSNSKEHDRNLNQRFNFNIEWKPDTVNYFKISPNYNYSNVHTAAVGASNLIKNTTDTATDYNYNTVTRTATPSYAINVLYNHRFNSHGLNFSANVGAGTYHTNEYQNPIYEYLAGVATAPANQIIYTSTRTDTLGTTLSYLQPIAGKSYIELNYNYHFAHNTADKLTDTLAGDSYVKYDELSNDYSYNFVTNRFGLNYRFIDKKYNYTIGVSAQPSSLTGSSPETGSTHINTFNVSPLAHFVYNFSRTQSLSINYSGASNQPLYTELQPVTDFSSALYPVEGNPDLKPEYSNTLTLRYNKFDFASGNVFFSNLNFVQTDNKIVANTVTYPKTYAPDPKLAGTILTQYQNASGYSQASAFYLFAKPWEKRKYTLMYNGNVSYTNNISYLTSVDSNTYAEDKERNVAKTLALTQGLRFRLDITDVVDAEVNGNYTINHSDNSLKNAGLASNFRTMVLGVNGRNYFWKNWTLSYDYTKTFYYGYSNSTNPNILNMYVERRFLKNNVATIRLAANDLFNQNTGFASTQNGTYITQTNANKLGRYYMATFILRLQKFAGTKPNMGPGGPGGFRGPGPGGPPPGGM